MSLESTVGLPARPSGAVERVWPVWYALGKMATDCGVATLILILLSPLLALLAALVRLTSRGPAIYRQQRVGRNGREFTIYKFRTMLHDCERLSGPQWSSCCDPRVTTLGRMLRGCHLDELPQLWNVIRGEMSLVGPRPERPEFVPELEQAIPSYRQRLRIRPGLTGLSQVQLPPDLTLEDVRRKVACDLCYIRQAGPWLDLLIFVGTVLKVAHVPYEVTRRILNLPGVESSRPDDDPPGPTGSITRVDSGTPANFQASRGDHDLFRG